MTVLPPGEKGESALGPLDAVYEVVSTLPEARADLPLLLRVRVRNTGAVVWPDQGRHSVNLSYHWLDHQGQVVDFEGVWAKLPAPLPPGDSVELELQVEPPPAAGSYQLALDLVEDGRGWFSQRGVAPLLIPLQVAPGPLRAPRVCIFGPLCMINDAVGNHMINQMRFFQARGYQALILVEHLDVRQPAGLRRHMLAVSYAELRSGAATPANRRALEYFRSSDLYIFHFPLAYPLFEAITLVERGVVIVDYHGVTPPKFWDGERRASFLLALQQRALVRYADYVIVHSAFARQELLQAAAIAPERVFVHTLVVPLERFQPGPRPAALVARYGLGENWPILLYVGRMAGNKRIEDLIRALALIRARYPGAALLLVGDDCSPAYAPVAERARRLAASLGVAGGVIFTGQVPDAELVAHYQLADVFVTASTHEGFCIPVIEAMACGVPVVGAHATALPETIGAAGLTFRPEDPADLAEKVLVLLCADLTAVGSGSIFA